MAEIREDIANLKANDVKLFKSTQHNRKTKENIDMTAIQKSALAAIATAAHALAASAQALAASFEETTPAAAPEPKKEPAKKKEEKKEPPPAAAPPAAAPDLAVQARDKAVAFAKASGKDALVAIVRKYTDKTVKDVPAEKLAEFIADLDAASKPSDDVLG